MITNELNTGLVNAVREKLPSKDNLANALMDILYIGKETIYRRLRGEVPFTLTEAAIISRKLGISLDKMIGVSFQDNAVFDMNIVGSNKPLETYYSVNTALLSCSDTNRLSVFHITHRIGLRIFQSNKRYH